MCTSLFYIRSCSKLCCYDYLGAGKFGTVYSCMNMDTSELMAVKQVCRCKCTHMQ